MASLWDCDECGYNHYETASQCKHCGAGSNLTEKVAGEMYVYQVGEFCEYEGGGWSVVVADNDKTFENILKVLIDYHKEQSKPFERIMNDRDEATDDICKLSKEAVDEQQQIIQKLKQCKSLNELDGLSVGFSDVVSISKCEVIGGKD